MEMKTASLYESWARLSDQKEALHRELTQNGLWGQEQSRQAYLYLTQESERAFIAYSASRKGVSEAQASYEQNSVMSSRFD
jgi:hypothetical protein